MEDIDDPFQVDGEKYREIQGACKGEDRSMFFIPRAPVLFV